VSYMNIHRSFSAPCMYQTVSVTTEIVQVMSAYESAGPEQLTISPGQLIHVYKKSSSGWWEGELQVSTED